jgi:hypothetical protein
MDADSYAPGVKRAILARNRKRMAQMATTYPLAPWVRTAADILQTLPDATAR